MTPERENEISYAIGLALGRIMRAGICLAGFAGLTIAVVATGETKPMPAKTELAKVAPVKAPVAKPIKHRIKAKKKCACHCEKAIDKPLDPVIVIVLETPIEELSDGIS